MRRQCSGLTPSCIYASILGGVANPTNTPDLLGRVECLQDVLVTSIALVTQTKSGEIVIETAPTVFTSTTTSFPQLQGTTSISASFNGSMPFNNVTSAKGTFSSKESYSSGLPQSYSSTNISTGSSTSLDGIISYFSPQPPSSSSGVVLSEPTAVSATIWRHTPSITTLSQTASMPIAGPISQPTVEGVFVNSASKLVTPLASSITVSLVSTLTVLRSLSAKCGRSVN